MITPQKLEQILFFDTETVSEVKSLNDYKKDNPRKIELWKKKADQIRSKDSDLSNKTDEQLYEMKAGLFPEFARIVCASFGLLDFEDPAKPVFNISSFSDADETKILKSSRDLINNFMSSNSKNVLCGHNIKGFDIPMLGKRFVINGLNPPKSLNLIDKKPWDMPFLDSMDAWSFGGFGNPTSLDLLATSLGIGSSKTILNNDQVGTTYWNENNLPKIVIYCEADVKVLMEIFLYLSNLK